MCVCARALTIMSWHSYMYFLSRECEWVYSQTIYAKTCLHCYTLCLMHVMKCVLLQASYNHYSNSYRNLVSIQ
jgi:hypothetical protein